MKKTINSKIVEWGAATIIVIALMVLFYGLSWIVTCGIIKLITMCFGLAFKWSVASGIWLIIVLVQSIFKSNSTRG
ncbi:MAG TPA: hypothetical protein DC053_03855 [Lachnoclostridium sp.]|nr:hypothetical protein [Lachnoclostridium sp.]